MTDRLVYALGCIFGGFVSGANYALLAGRKDYEPTWAGVIVPLCVAAFFMWRLTSHSRRTS